MYKVLKYLPGYGYLVGDVTDKIKPKDVQDFLKSRLIEKVEAEQKATPKPGPKKAKK